MSFHSDAFGSGDQQRVILHGVAVKAHHDLITRHGVVLSVVTGTFENIST
jgi:hypothetical protein